MVGFATHVLWDSFTHSWHRRYWDWAWLDETAYGSIPVFGALQYFSSFFGLGVLLWWAVRGLARQEARAGRSGARHEADHDGGAAAGDAPRRPGGASRPRGVTR